jgi:hypothetical protein
MSVELLKRRAIIVGISEYSDEENIKKLDGAEHDARSVWERLKDPLIAGFDIEDNHFLTNEDATCLNIRQAISDVFYQTDRSSDLALFYFSGHGHEVEWYNEGYIAPYDFDVKHPLVSGIKMSELTQIISKSVESKHVKSAMTILDCCYSGIAIQGDKATFDPKYKRKYDERIQDFSSGRGMIILSSSGEDEKSREISNCVHKYADEKNLTHMEPLPFI